MKSGTLNNDGKHSMIYRGIENIYGNIWQLVDGINFKNNYAYINYNPKTYKEDIFDGDYYQIGYINATGNTNANAYPIGFVTELGYDNTHSLIMFPTAINGKDGTYIPDYYYPSNGKSRISVVGGGWGANKEVGLWQWSHDCLPTTNHNGWSARLLRYA